MCSKKKKEERGYSQENQTYTSIELQEWNSNTFAYIASIIIAITIIS